MRKSAECDFFVNLMKKSLTFRLWINKEIDIAQSGFSSSKPIIAIQPWAAEKTSTVVKNAADRIVGWNTKSIVNAIKELG